MLSRVVVWAAGLAAGLLALAACGVGDSADGDAADPAAAGLKTASTPTSAPPTEVGPAGTPDPEALTGFVCVPEQDGSWSASGTLTNTADRPAGFVVTVTVAGSQDVTAEAKRQRISALGAGESVDLRLRRLPAPASSDLTCQAQVLRH